MVRPPTPSTRGILAFACLLVAMLWARDSLGQDTANEQYVAAGIYETGLTAALPEDAVCPEIASGFADAFNRSGRPRGAYAQWALHAGTDFALSDGTPIVAIADGKVVARGSDEPGSEPGNFVTIEHPHLPGAISSNYVHLSAFNVDKGQSVKQGQVIGFVGRTGNGVTFSHLHLNIYGRQVVRVGKGRLRYRHDFLQVLSRDMTPIDPVKKRMQKVTVAYMDQYGRVHPANAKVIWPFVCERSTE